MDDAIVRFAIVFSLTVFGSFLFFRLLGGLERRLIKKLKRPELEVTILATEKEIMASDTKTQIRIAWNDIKKIAAFKRDLYTTDMICLLIETKEGVYELNERMKGFKDLFGPMERNLSVSPEWYLSIMMPVFDTNTTIIYEKKTE